MSVKVLLLSFALCAPVAAMAQNFQVAFGGLQQDAAQSVEVTADSLSLNQKDGSAIFKGNVLIIQGTMRISAPVVNVFYNDETQGIARLFATDGVILVNGKDAAEADRADYNIEGSTIEMLGDVILSQGNNTLTSDRMTVNLETGSAEMHGRVKTVLRSGDN